MLGLYTCIPVDFEICKTSFHGDHLENPYGFKITIYEEDIPMKTDFIFCINWQSAEISGKKIEMGPMNER